MPNLFPVWDLPAPVMPTEQTGPAYGKDLALDLETGDLVFDGAGRPVMLDGWRAWQEWCVRAVLTERGAYLAHSHRFGADLEDVRRAESRQAAEAEAIRVITEALTVDPRTRSVRDFTFRWQGDSLWITCTVEPALGQPAGLEVTIRG